MAGTPKKRMRREAREGAGDRAKAMETLPAEPAKERLPAVRPRPKAPPEATPTAIRQRVRGSFDKRIPVLEKIVDNPREPSGTKVKAMDILGRYAGLEKISYDPDLVGELWLIVDRYVHDPDALDAIREGWLGVVAEYLR